MDIRSVPLTGTPIHGHEDHGHDIAGYDIVGAGSAALGAVGYSLLRGQGINMLRYRQGRVDSLMAELRSLRELWDQINRVDHAEAEKVHRQRAKLFVWDVIRETG